MTKEKGDSVLNTRYCQVRSGVGPWPPAWSPDDLCDWPFFSPPRCFLDACALVTCQVPADLPPCRQRGLKRERISAAESLCCQSRNQCVLRPGDDVAEWTDKTNRRKSEHLSDHRVRESDFLLSLLMLLWVHSVRICKQQGTNSQLY